MSRLDEIQRRNHGQLAWIAFGQLAILALLAVSGVTWGAILGACALVVQIVGFVALRYRRKR